MIFYHYPMVQLSLFEILSRSEIPRYEGALIAKINDLHFWENNVYLQRLNRIAICIIFVYAMPLAGTKIPNVLNASSENCNCERVFVSSAKLQLTRSCTDSSSECVYKTWHWKFISRYPNVCASKLLTLEMFENILNNEINSCGVFFHINLIPLNTWPPF